MSSHRFVQQFSHRLSTLTREFIALCDALIRCSGEASIDALPLTMYVSGELSRSSDSVSQYLPPTDRRDGRSWGEGNQERILLQRINKAYRESDL